MSRGTHHAPIILFVYNRPDCTKKTLEALARNYGADEADLVIFSDGPRSEEDKSKITAVRAIAAAAAGFRSVRLVEAAENRGLARSIIAGVTDVVEERGRAIVMEDDIITSPYFLRFMNDALELYADEPKVAAISGYTHPLGKQMPETFFLRDSSCWGWATWARAWSKFNPDGAALLSQIEARGAVRAFNHDGSFDFTLMLRDQIAGKNNSWAIRWRASLFLEGLLSLYPGQSLTCNIGNDGRGTHTGAAETFWGDRVADRPVAVSPIPLIVDAEIDAAISAFYRKNIATGLRSRIKHKIKRMLRP